MVNPINSSNSATGAGGDARAERGGVAPLTILNALHHVVNPPNLLLANANTSNSNKNPVGRAASTVGIQVSEPNIDDINRRVNELKPVALKLVNLLGIDDPRLRRFVEAPLGSTILGVRLTYQLPPEKAENSFKFYPMIGYVARFVAARYQRLLKDRNLFNQALAQFDSNFQNNPNNLEDHDTIALKLALRDVFSNTVLVGPTSGSFGIGMYRMAAILRELTLGGKDLFDTNHTVTALPLFPPNPEMPSPKWEKIKEMHVAQNTDPKAQALGSQPSTYGSRPTRDADAMRMLLQSGRGFYVPTNPLSLSEVKALVKIIVGDIQSVTDLTAAQLQQLENLSVKVDSANNTLIVSQPVDGALAGSAVSLQPLQTYLANSQVETRAVFPSSAGSGIIGPVHAAHNGVAIAEIAPDPAISAWRILLTETPSFYRQPAANIDSSTIPSANGMGSHASSDSPVALMVVPMKERGLVVLTETTDVLRRIARALLHIDLTASAVINGQPLVPYPELASATPLAAQLERKLREVASQHNGVQIFAQRFAQTLSTFGISANDFWRLASLDAPYADSSSVLSKLRRLAEIQGARTDGGENFLLRFITELGKALDQTTAHPTAVPTTAISQAQSSRELRALVISGMNGSQDPKHQKLAQKLTEGANCLGLMSSDTVPQATQAGGSVITPDIPSAEERVQLERELGSNYAAESRPNDNSARQLAGYLQKPTPPKKQDLTLRLTALPSRPAIELPRHTGHAKPAPEDEVHVPTMLRFSKPSANDWVSADPILTQALSLLRQSGNASALVRQWAATNTPMLRALLTQSGLTQIVQYGLGGRFLSALSQHGLSRYLITYKTAPVLQSISQRHPELASAALSLRTQVLKVLEARHAALAVAPSTAAPLASTPVSRSRQAPPARPRAANFDLQSAVQRLQAAATPQARIEALGLLQTRVSRLNQTLTLARAGQQQQHQEMYRLAQAQLQQMQAWLSDPQRIEQARVASDIAWKGLAVVLTGLAAGISGAAKLVFQPPQP